MSINISYIAIDRIAQGGRHLFKEGKKKELLSDARKHSDAILLGRLTSMGINLNREVLREYIECNPSSENIANEFSKYNLKDSDSDKCWHAITILWERWFPDIPHLESLDDKMQEGYSLLKDAKTDVSAIEKWQEYWIDAKWMMKKWGISSIREFDQKLPQSQRLSNWVQDYDETLHNVAIHDKRYNNVRLSFCSEVVTLFDNDDLLMIQNFRRSIADSNFNLGKPEITDTLYSQWLKENPKWSWGWIGWSDCYSFFKGTSTENLLKSERILKEAMDVEGIDEKEYILDRLLGVYKQMKNETGINSITQSIESLSKAMKQVKQSSHSATPTPTPTMSNDKCKIGRNEPCPCGSGKKFKKCCGNI